MASEGEQWMDAQLSLNPAERAASLVPLGVPKADALIMADAIDRTMAYAILALCRSAVLVHQDWDADFAGVPAPRLMLAPPTDPFARAVELSALPSGGPNRPAPVSVGLRVQGVDAHLPEAMAVLFEDSRARTPRGKPLPLVACVLQRRASSIGQPGCHHARWRRRVDPKPAPLRVGQQARTPASWPTLRPRVHRPCRSSTPARRSPWAMPG